MRFEIKPFTPAEARSLLVEPKTTRQSAIPRRQSDRRAAMTDVLELVLDLIAPELCMYQYLEREPGIDVATAAPTFQM